jgi:hypothetical protein
MNCKRYQQLLHLNRAGELSKPDAEDLRQHLAQCEECSLELRRIQRADEFLDPLRSFSPAPPNPEKLTADIMQRVREAALRVPSESVVNRILDFFLIPSVRYAALGVISSVSILLIVQSLVLLYDISSLEESMASASTRRGEAVYTARSETLREAATSAEGRPLVRSLPLTVSDGHIQAPASVVDLFLSKSNLENLPAIIGSSAIRVDRKTLEKIIDEIKATVELTFHAG